MTSLSRRQMATRQRDLFSYEQNRAETANTYLDEIAGNLREHFGVPSREVVNYEELEGAHAPRSALIEEHGPIGGQAMWGCQRLDVFGVDFIVCDGMPYVVGNRVTQGTGETRRFTIREHSGSPELGEAGRLKRYYEERRGLIPSYYSFSKHAPGAQSLAYWCLIDTREFLDLWFSGDLGMGVIENDDGTSGFYFNHEDLAPAIDAERGEF